MKANIQWFVPSITAFFLIVCFLQSGSAEQPAIVSKGIKVAPVGEDALIPKVHIHDLMPQVVLLDSMVNLYEAVEFDHEMHAVEAGCSTCHHHIIEHTDTNCEIHNVVDQTNNPYCAQCHKGWFPGSLEKAKCRDCHSPERYTAEYLDKIEHDRDINHHDHMGLMGAFHNQCVGCHVEKDIGGCQDCHKRSEAGDKQFRVGVRKSGAKKKSSGHGGH